MSGPQHYSGASGEKQPASVLQTSYAKNPRVLIVDDDPGVVSLLTHFLSRRNFDCFGYVSVERALDFLKRSPVDALIADLRMPVFSGLDLLRKVKKDLPFIAFLMATGVNEIHCAIEAMKEGADDYLVKPFDLESVASSLERALVKKGHERESYVYRQSLEKTVGVQSGQLQDAMQRVALTHDETLEALGAALDLRDNETAGHSQRVMRYSTEIAHYMRCPEELITDIARGAFLHDIGKIGIPDHILRKPAKLTDKERDIMRTHVQIGYAILSRVAFLRRAAEIVLTHHERFDGAGYPQGLRGTEIPLGSRIFVVADTLDAMTSDRVYRQALPFSAARSEIRQECGKQFDPDVVKAFLAIDQNIFEKIRLGGSVQKPPGASHTVTVAPLRGGGSCMTSLVSLARDKNTQATRTEN